jgi:hypothetical protein
MAKRPFLFLTPTHLTSAFLPSTANLEPKANPTNPIYPVKEFQELERSGLVRQSLWRI